MINFKPRKTKNEIGGHNTEKDKYYTLSVNANNWRKMSFSLLILVVLLIFALLRASSLNKIETIVLEKIGNNYEVVGNVLDVAKTQVKATDQQIIYFLNEVISNTKSLPKSTEIYEKNYRKSLAYLSRNASQKIDNYLKREGYVEKVKAGKTVEISLNTGLKISDKTYQIRWTQATFLKNGELEKEVNYNAIITVDFKDITDVKLLYINPLGLVITDFSQQEELLNKN